MAVARMAVARRDVARLAADHILAEHAVEVWGEQRQALYAASPVYVLFPHPCVS